MTFNTNPSELVARGRIALVQSCWHRDIVDGLRDGFITEFAKLDGRPVDVFEVPGAYEIPLQAKFLALSKKYAAVVAAGLVVDGGVYRHEFVAHAVIDGLMRVQLDSGIPVFSAVLTPQDFQSAGQAAFFAEHFVMKGTEAAQACAATLASYGAANAV